MLQNESEAITIELVRLISEFRKAKNLTLEDLADLAGMHRTTVGLWEKGERTPTVDSALRIASALDIELSELLARASANVAGVTPPKAKVKSRLVDEHDLHNPEALRSIAKLELGVLKSAIEHTYQTLDTIDFELMTQNSPPISGLVELANLSSMVGNIVSAGVAKASNGLYKKNRPHSYPDLLSASTEAVNLEVKMALEKNRPKGHLPKPGTYLTFRYILADSNGKFVRGKAHRGETVFIWEVRVGVLTESDFDLSNTDGDSGKTAVIKTKVFEAMEVVYFVKEFSPYARVRPSHPIRQHPDLQDRK